MNKNVYVRKGDLTNDPNSGDYNPFFTGEDNLYSEQLTEEQMKEKGYTECTGLFDPQTGYYAYCYK